MVSARSAELFPFPISEISVVYLHALSATGIVPEHSSERGDTMALGEDSTSYPDVFTTVVSAVLPGFHKTTPNRRPTLFRLSLALDSGVAFGVPYLSL